MIICGFELPEALRYSQVLLSPNMLLLLKPTTNDKLLELLLSSQFQWQLLLPTSQFQWQILLPTSLNDNSTIQLTTTATFQVLQPTPDVLHPITTFIYSVIVEFTF